MKMWVLMFAIFILAEVEAQTNPAKVMIMEIKDEIDPRMNRYVKLGLEHAVENEMDYIIIEMDTYGGTLADAKDIVDLIMANKIPTWVFINADAASAGALISIACDSIYMAPGASIGAATVVDGSGQKAPDKYQSYMRSIMRSTAEENHRDPKIAEAMVDEDVEVKGIKEKGKILTFSTSEAIQHGYCEARVTSVEEILQRNQVEPYTLYPFELSAVDTVVAFFLNPAISGLLILVIFGGLYFELQTPGVGFPGLAALVALILYLVPYYLNGLAENWEILALFSGVILIALEVFVLPGFGIAGISGIILTVGSLVLIMVNNDSFNFDFVPLNNVLYAFAAVMGGLLGGLILLSVGGARLDRTKFYQRVALTQTQAKEQGFVVNNTFQLLIGKTGVAHSVLRPGGKVEIERQIYDAMTRGEYIDKDQAVKVIGVEGTTLKVTSLSA